VHCVNSPFTLILRRRQNTSFIGRGGKRRSVSTLSKHRAFRPGKVEGLIVISGLTKPAPYLIRGNPAFSIWIAAGVYPYLIRGRNGGFGTYVKKRWAHYVGGADTEKIVRHGGSRKIKRQRTNELKFSNLFLI
jgi:hypothetical protein